jgi:hypothetical protein
VKERAAEIFEVAMFMAKGLKENEVNKAPLLSE